MVFCFSSQWTLSSFERTASMLRNQKSRKTRLPIVLVQLQSEVHDLGNEAVEMAKKHNAKLIKVSVVKGTGVNEVFEAAVAAVVEAKKEPALAPTASDSTNSIVSFTFSAPAPAPAPVANVEAAKKQEKAEPTIWKKLLGKFLGETPVVNAKEGETKADDVAPVA